VYFSLHGVPLLQLCVHNSYLVVLLCGLHLLYHFINFSMNFSYLLGYVELSSYFGHGVLQKYKFVSVISFHQPIVASMKYDFLI
jgi:hypothetical protein